MSQVTAVTPALTALFTFVMTVTVTQPGGTLLTGHVGGDLDAVWTGGDWQWWPDTSGPDIVAVENLTGYVPFSAGE